MKDVRAVVREVNGQLVLDDPDAIAVFKAVAKHNCRLMVQEQAERVAHFKRRAIDKGTDNVVVVLLNVNDPIGKEITDILMPGQDAMWQAIRDSGQIPFARGLVQRDAFQELVTELDAETGEKLRAMTGVVAVVVVDHGVVEVVEA